MEINELRRMLSNLSTMGEIISTPMGEKWLEKTFDIKGKEDVWLVLEELYSAFVKSDTSVKFNDYLLEVDVDTDGLWEEINKECKASNELCLLAFLHKNIPLPNRESFRNYIYKNCNSEMCSAALEYGVESLDLEEKKKLLDEARDYLKKEIDFEFEQQE